MAPQWWEVKSILGKRERDGSVEYRVDWDGINPHTRKPWTPTWEPVQNLDAPDLVEAWEEKNGQLQERSMSPEIGEFVPYTQVPSKAETPKLSQALSTSSSSEITKIGPPRHAKRKKFHESRNRDLAMTPVSSSSSPSKSSDSRQKSLSTTLEPVDHLPFYYEDDNSFFDDEYEPLPLLTPSPSMSLGKPPSSTTVKARMKPKVHEGGAGDLQRRVSGPPLSQGLHRPSSQSSSHSRRRFHTLPVVSFKRLQRAQRVAEDRQ